MINARYTVPNPITDKLSIVWSDMYAAYGVTALLLIGGQIALVARSLRRSRDRPASRIPPSVLLPAMAARLVVGLAWTLRDYDSWADLFPVLPFAAIGVGGVFALAERHLARRTAGVVAAGLSVVAVVLALAFSVSTRNDTLDMQQHDVDAVMRAAAEGRDDHLDRGAAAVGAHPAHQPDALPDVPRRPAGLHG